MPSNLPPDEAVIRFDDKLKGLNVAFEQFGTGDATCEMLGEEIRVIFAFLEQHAGPLTDESIGRQESIDMANDWKQFTSRDIRKTLQECIPAEAKDITKAFIPFTADALESKDTERLRDEAATARRSVTNFFGLEPIDRSTEEGIVGGDIRCERVPDSGAAESWMKNQLDDGVISMTETTLVNGEIHACVLLRELAEEEF